MEKLIIWFKPQGKDKKLQLNQFHTEAETQAQAINNFKEYSKQYDLKILGIGSYAKAGVSDENFVNNKFY